MDKTILIADDDDTVRRVYTVRCREMGLAVRIAPDAMMALTLIHKQPPDLLLLDANMPAGSGVGVIEMLRSDARLVDLPIILFSGAADDAVARRCTALGAAYIPKGPDAWVRLKPTIERLLYPEGDAAAAPRSAAA